MQDQTKNQTNQDKEQEPIKDAGNQSLPLNNQGDDFGNFKVNKKGFIEINGEITETLPSITFRVKLENGYEILARLSGRMRMNRIMLIPGDKVRIEMSPYDLTKGRITYRY